ncbi:ABC transporter [Escherichia coli]|nr:ABC transporter [Escherichia coli]
MSLKECSSVVSFSIACTAKEGANKQVISSQADSLIKISRIWADFFPANTSNQPI